MSTTATTNTGTVTTGNPATTGGLPPDPLVGKPSAKSESLSNWAGPYVTSMLGRAQAISEQPYQVYQGPLTAGESSLQQKYFQGLGNLAFPQQLGQSFSAAGAPALPQQRSFLTQGQPQERGRVEDFNRMMSGIPGMPTMPTMPTQTHGGTLSEVSGGAAQLSPDAQTPLGQQMLADIKKYASSVNQFGEQAQPSTAATGAAAAPTGIAAQYMNPYLNAVLAPQLSELQRQAQIAQMNTGSRLAQAGAYGGSRQAIMEAELQRNLLQQANKAIGEGYSSAYDKAMQQFNVEQGQAKDLASMMAGAGREQRAIEQEGITADLNEFLQQRDYPMKMLQFQQSMLQGLPISTVSQQYNQPSGLSDFMGKSGGVLSILKDWFGGK